MPDELARYVCVCTLPRLVDMGAGLTLGVGCVEASVPRNTRNKSSSNKACHAADGVSAVLVHSVMPENGTVC